MGVSKGKRAVLFAVAAAFFLTAAACGQFPMPLDVTSADGSGAGEKPGSDTQVIYVITELEEYDTEGNFDERFKYSYDEKGNLIEEINEYTLYDSDDISVSIDRYVYDDYGNLLKNVNGDGDVLYSYEYSYDDAGNVLTETETRYKYIRDNDGNVPTETRTTPSRTEYTEYSYDSIGKRTGKQTYDSNGNLKLSSTYDKNGNELTCELYDENGAVSYRIKYAYDEHGNLIFEKREDDGTVKITEYKKEYNEWGKYTSVTAFCNGHAVFNIECKYDERGYLTNLASYNSTGEYSGGVEYTRDANGNATQTITSFHDSLGIAKRRTVFKYQAIEIPSYLAEEIMERQEYLFNKYAGGI